METDTLQFDSKAALRGFLDRESVPYIILGANAEAPREFFAIDVPREEEKPLRIGIIASGTGIQPSLIRSLNRRCCAVGHDATVSLVDLGAARCSANIHLEGVFFEFIAFDSGDGFIVVHELGAVGMRFPDEELWSVSTDVLKSWRIAQGGKLILSQLDGGKETVVDLVTGTLKRPS